MDSYLSVNAPLVGGTPCAILLSRPTVLYYKSLEWSTFGEGNCGYKAISLKLSTPNVISGKVITSCFIHI